MARAPAQGDPPLLSAGELLRAPGGVARSEPDELEHLADPRRAPPLGAGQAEGDVLGDGQMREERTFLGDVADRPLVGCDVHPAGVGDDAPVDRDRASVGRDEPDDQTQQGRLAAARGAQDRRQRSLRERRDRRREDGSRPVGLGQVVQRSSAISIVVPSARTLPKRLIST